MGYLDGKPKIKLLTTGLWGGPSSWFADGYLLAVSTRGLFSVCEHGRISLSLSPTPFLPVSHKALNCIGFVPSLMISFNLNYLPKVLPPNIITLEG